MPLDLYIIIIAKYFFPPQHLALGFFNIARHYQLWNLATKTCRTNNKAFAVGGNSLFICSRMRIKALCPSLRHNFHQIVISLFVFCQYNQVTASIALVNMLVQRLLRHIHFATEYRLKQTRLVTADFCLQRPYSFNIGPFLACF